MFKVYHGAQQVPGGIYFCLATGTYAQLGAGSVLPGDAEARYVRLNVLLTLILGPLTGLFFIIALPLMAPVFVIWVALRAMRKHAPAAPSEGPRLLPGSPH